MKSNWKVVGYCKNSIVIQIEKNRYLIPISQLNSEDSECFSGRKRPCGGCVTLGSFDKKYSWCSFSRKIATFI